MRTSNSAENVVNNAAKIMAEALDADRLLIGEGNEDRTHCIMSGYDACQVKFPGTVLCVQFGSIGAVAQQHIPVVIDNVNIPSAESRTGIHYPGGISHSFTDEERENLLQYHIESLMVFPVVKGGRWMANVNVHCSRPRTWNQEDFDFLTETGERVWEVMMRLRSEDALRITKQRYITELEKAVRKRTAELKQSRDLFQSTMDASMDMIQVFEAVRNEQGEIVDFKYILLNHEAEKKMPFSLGESLLDTQPGVVKEGIFEAFKQVVETGISQQYEIHYVHEQFYGWYYQSVVKLGDGVTATTSDITQRKKAEELLRQSKDLLQNIIDAPNIGMAVYKAIRDEKGSITDYDHEYINRASIEMLGEDFTGRLFSEHGESALSQMPYFKEAIESGKGNSYVREINLHGRKVWFAITNTPLDDSRLLQTWEDITERKKTEEEILRLKDEITQRATDKYYSIFNSIDEGFCIFELIYDENNKPIDLKWVEVNPAYEKQTGLKGVTGKTHRELSINTENHWYEIYDRVIKTGEALHFEEWHEPTRRWYYTFSSRVGEQGSKQVAVVFSDVTERKHREANLAFLAELMKDFAPRGSVEEIMKTAAARILDHLQLSQCSFIEVNYPLRECTILYNLGANGAASMTGTYKLTDFYTEDENRLLASGQPMVINNVEDGTRPQQKAKAFHEIGVGSVVNIPYLSNGSWVFNLVVTRSGATIWSKEEIALLQDICSRVWLRIERAKAEEMLRISEEKYHMLFDSIDQGFCTIEVLFDKIGKPFDYRFLEINPAFIKQTNIQNALGRSMREIEPQHEDFWFEMYGRIAKTGEPHRFQHKAEALGRFYDVYAFRIGKPGQNKVAIIFNDILARVQAEAALNISEEKYRTIFNTMDVGFVFCEAMMDENGNITDILYLDNNPASAKMMGQDFKGKKASELYPATKDHWCSRAQKVLKSNKGERYEFYSELAGKYINAYAVKIPALGENMLAIVFQEAIETKKE